MGNAAYSAERYAAFYRSTGWCDVDPAVDLVAEPEACGPSIEALCAARRPYESRRFNAFDPSWSPDERLLEHAEFRLNFN